METQNLKKVSVFTSIILVLCFVFSPFSVYAAKNNAYKDLKVYLGGMPFGIKIQTEGVSIQGLCEVISGGEKYEPAKDAGLELFDKITVVNGKKIYSAKEITDILTESQGKAEITYIRNNKEYTVNLKAVLDDKDNRYKCGLVLKDTAAGIGTVTFIDPNSNTFAGLGHGIYDMGNQELIRGYDGTIEKVKIIGIVKGMPGTPGEIRGTFSGGKCGEFIMNADEGVFGHFDALPECTDSEDLINIASKDEIKEGKAHIYCTLGDTEPQKYEVEIEKILNYDTKTKNFIICITDERLLNESGGIIQGMSGSPIVQNGKLVGATTHVLINDPTHGYGIFIENMLDKMGEIRK